MKYDHKQRINMALHGVDPDEIENPRQKLPPVEIRLQKLRRKMEEGGPKARDYAKKAEVYKVLLHPEQSKKRGLWESLWR